MIINDSTIIRETILRCSQTFSNGVTVVNTTPRPITFLDGEEIVTVDCDPSLIINATSSEEQVGPFQVRSKFSGNETGQQIIDEIKSTFEDKEPFIIGSILAANSYKDVVSMCPAPGFERVPPDQKRMSIDRFNIGEPSYDEIVPQILEPLLDRVSVDGLPESLQTPEICGALVKYNGAYLEYIPEHLKTPEMCLMAIKGDKIGGAWALQFVPDDIKTEEMCLTAVEPDDCGGALQYVPEKLQTAEMCLTAVQHSDQALKYVRGDLITQELCMAAVKSDGYALEYVPKHIQTSEICEEAVKEYIMPLQYVRKDLQTPELCSIAFNNEEADFDSIGFFETDLLTEEICMAAVKHDGRALQYVPVQLQTPEICQAAVAQNEDAAYYVVDPSILQVDLTQNQTDPEQAQIKEEDLEL